MSDTPFVTDDQGYYLVAEPVVGMTPEALSVVVDGTTYVLTDYVGTHSASRFQPDVLRYETCTVSGDGGE